MSDELRACPFCGTASSTKELFGRPHCNNEACSFYAIACSPTAWNHRPLEDALQAKVDALVELVSEQDKRFAHLVSEHGIAGSHLRSVSDAREKCRALGVAV